jgi:ribose transport system ATP-binding protein
MTAILDVRDLSKTFTGQRALDHVAIEVRAGEVHALVGKNGSGKSTLAKVLSGYHSPDSGCQVRLLDADVSFPLDGEHRHLLQFVHQDLGLVETLSVLDNIGLSHTFRTNRFGKIDWKHSQERASRALGAFGLGHLDLTAPLSTLTASERAIVAIARGLIGWDGGVGLLVLDETTAALPPHEVAVLERAIERVTSRGAGILYITHRLDEVFAFADRVTVLRDGHSVGTFATGDLRQEQLVTLMIGERKIEKLPDPQVRQDVVLRCDRVQGPGIDDLTMTVRSGEIVGVAGLLGSGRESVADVVFGAVPAQSGTVELEGKVLVNRSPKKSLNAGIALVPSDRAKRGIFPALSIRENISLARLRTLTRALKIDRRREDEEAAEWVDKVGLVPAEPDRAVSTLSGGNQQKTVLARALRLSPRLLLLDEATQGVDVGAKRSIHNLIRTAAAAGAGVVVCTAESEDLPALCHRVIVMRDGRVADVLEGERLTQANVLGSCTGASVHEDA